MGKKLLRRGTSMIGAAAVVLGVVGGGLVGAGTASAQAEALGSSVSPIASSEVPPEQVDYLSPEFGAVVLLWALWVVGVNDQPYTGCTWECPSALDQLIDWGQGSVGS